MKTNNASHIVYSRTLSIIITSAFILIIMFALTWKPSLFFRFWMLIWVAFVLIPKPEITDKMYQNINYIVYILLSMNMSYGCVIHSLFNTSTPGRSFYLLRIHKTYPCVKYLVFGIHVFMIYMVFISAYNNITEGKLSRLVSWILTPAYAIILSNVRTTVIPYTRFWHSDRSAYETTQCISTLMSPPLYNLWPWESNHIESFYSSCW